MGWVDRLFRRQTMAHAPRRKFSYSPVADAINASLSRDTGPVDRDLALTVPAVLRGRNLICSISTLPLVQYRSDGAVEPSALLAQIDPDVANVVTVAQTVEDLLFDAIAWWRVKGYGNVGGQLRPVQARRVDPCTVSLTPPPRQPSRSPLPSGEDPRSAVVYVDGKPVPAQEMIRFDSPNPALRVAAARSIRKALLIDKLASTFADNPRPLDYFEPSDYATEDPDDDDIKEFLSQWKLYRKGNSTGYIPRDYKYQSVSQPSPVELQLVQLQQQAGLEIANMFGLDPYDLGVNVASRDYANVIDRRRDRINDVLSPYMLAITQRLSMNDLTVRGNRVDMDLDNYLKSNPTERWSVYETASRLGVIPDPEEIRLKEGWGPMPAPKQTAPAEPKPVEPVEDPASEPVPADASKRPERVMTASAEFTFDRPRSVSSPRAPREFVDIPLQTFAVDREERTITGLSVPYGKQTSKYGGIRFEKGALEYAEVSHVKLLMHHDPWQPVGVATELKETRDGLVAKFRLGRNAAADEALMQAEDGIIDGLSVGVDFSDEDIVEDPRYRGGLLVKRADLREVSLTAMPAFRDARVTKVAASDDNTEGDTVSGTEPTTTEPITAPAAPAVEPAPASPPTPDPAPVQTSAIPATVTLTQDQFTALLARLTPAPAPAPIAVERPAVVDPTSRPVPTVTVTRDALPYRFARGGIVAVTPEDIAAGQHSFGRDVLAMRGAGDEYGETPAGKRVMGMLQRYHNAVTRNFAIPTTATDIAALIPTEVLAYQASPAFHLPLFELVNAGPLPNGLQPFLPPAMNESTTDIAVATHTEGTEPTAKEFITQGNAITPSPLSGKVNITRVALDRVSNVDALVWDELTKQYYKTVEDRVATFLATLTAADNIALDGLSHIGLADTWASAYIFLQKGRRYNFVALALEEALFKKFAGARDSSGAGQLCFPPVSFTPTNVSGTMAERYLSINLNGVTGIMSGALSTGNSYLFDPAYVKGHATAPTRLDFAGSGASNIYTPVDTVDVAVWGYSAFYNTQIAAVREITFNNAS